MQSRPMAQSPTSYYTALYSLQQIYFRKFWICHLKVLWLYCLLLWYCPLYQTMKGALCQLVVLHPLAELSTWCEHFPKVGYIKTEWILFKTSILIVAAKTYGLKVLVLVIAPTEEHTC